MSEKQHSQFWSDAIDRRLFTRTIAIVAAVFAITVSMWVVFLLRGYDLDDQGSAVAIAKDLLEIAAVLLGGLWTLRVYLRHRTDREAVAVSQTVTVVMLPDGRRLLRVFAKFHNIGKVHVHLKSWRVRADLLLPVSPKVAEILRGRTVFSERQAQWGSLTDPAQSELTGEDFDVRLEPGETELQIANLIVPEWAKVVQVYSLVQRGETTPPRGWSDRTTVNLTPEGPNAS